ncbi:MAG: AMP-binding protein [Acidimicrobiaceae bacterium]|nr:AMP-binding protein [Acidimicrobiaceae bacterium]MXW77271.1 AMP-binding protein [Acidimicrobiaceae bacterium]MYC42149.1 AMP-binding protein [Acidimicrobiaceae bacterium]MYD06778.1 AMP-binding protein [Acidimicrobiaceae bacterium]MYI59802.1 AMP-binding protein [Acidimicrobiaceae bacterium]
MALHCAMLSAIPVTFLARFDSERVLDSLRNATVMMGVPTHYSRLLENPRLDVDLASGIRLFTCGSAPLRDSVFEEFAERTGHRICERYGMSETGIITSNPSNDERLAGTVGYPLPGVELRVVDNDAIPTEAATPVEPGVIGSVEVRGPHVFSGYWHRDRVSTSTLDPIDADGWFTTGDLGSLDESGRLRLHGRSGDLIISGGENIYPKEIELVLDEVAGVRESAVIGVPDRDLGEAVIAVIVVDDERFALDNCNAELARKLSRHKHPKQIVVAPSLPRNAMGKIQKNVLREQHEQHEQHEQQQAIHGHG